MRLYIDYIVMTIVRNSEKISQRGQISRNNLNLSELVNLKKNGLVVREL
jgi:hypothetical protein